MGKLRVGEVTAGRKALSKQCQNDYKCDGGYEVVGSGGACGAESMDMESSHCLSNPILDGKMQALNKNDDYENNKINKIEFNGIILLYKTVYFQF